VDHFLPVTREEIEARGWDQPDFIYVTGDAYVDHPSLVYHPKEKRKREEGMQKEGRGRNVLSSEKKITVAIHCDISRYMV